MTDLVQTLHEAALRAEMEPEWFYLEILRFKPLPWQVEASEAVMDVRRPKKDRKYNLDARKGITIRSCHGPGKTQFLAMLMHLWSFTTYGKIACTAPKEAQLKQRLWPRYRKSFKDAVDWYKEMIDVNVTEITIAGDPDWGAIAETASDPDNLAGYHDDPQLFLVDEASAKRLDAMFPVIMGALSTPGSVCVEIGNPTRIAGEFYDHHMKSGVKDLYYKMHVKHTDAPGILSQEWVDSYILRYGANSPITMIRALGEFASYDEYLLIQPEYIEDALDIEEESDGSMPRLKISIDVADGGADSSVITAAREYETFTQILKQRAYWFKAGESAIRCAKAGMTFFEEFGGSVENGDYFTVDGLGVGAGTVGKLIELEQNVLNYKGGEASDNQSRWRNRRVQSYMGLEEAFMNGKIRFSPDCVDDPEEMRAHLLAIKRNHSNERVDDLETKDKCKASSGFSPDRADSLAMLYSTKTPQYSGESDVMIEIAGYIEASHYDAGLV